MQEYHNMKIYSHMGKLIGLKKLIFLTIFKSENVTETHFIRGDCKSRALQSIKIKGKVNMKILKYMIIALTENKA